MRPAAARLHRVKGAGPRPRGLIFTDLDATLLDHDTYDFSPALAALDAAREVRVPVILSSSKTRAEMLAWQERLGLSDPFVSENGGAAFFVGKGPLRPCFPEIWGGLPAKVFGTPYAELRRAIEELRSSFALPLHGFGDMEPGEIAELTGLPAADASLAGRRDFDEPFLWLAEPEEAQLEAVRDWLSGRRLQMLRGGRLWHLVGGNDKGHAVRWLLGAYAAVYGSRLPSLGLGDSENDLLMLHAVDRGVLVERPGGGHLPGVHPEIVHGPGIGPRGWAAAAIDWLRELGPTTSR